MSAPLPLRTAYTLAHRIAEELKPFCERIDVAGSIRRAREFVNDIDLVCQPRDHEQLRRRILARTEPISDGPDIIRTRLANGCVLEVFLAHGGRKDLLCDEPSNFISVLICRTGSKEHNIYLCKLAAEQGLKWETMRGLVVVEAGPGRTPGTVLPAQSEAVFFGHLGLDFISPAMRERV